MTPDPIVQYVSLLRDITLADFYGPFRCGYDEPPPLNLSRMIWMVSHESQRRYELDTLIIGRN